MIIDFPYVQLPVSQHQSGSLLLSLLSRYHPSELE